MLKSLRVPEQLLALNQMQRAATREAGAPLYLPAFQMEILSAEARQRDDDEEVVMAAGVTVGGDEDDDFY